jgi:hypothetical protein
MRKQLIALLLAGGAARGDAAPDKKPAAGGTIDLAPVRDHLDVYRDDSGNYYISPRPHEGDEDRDKYVFFGDGKTMYQQTIVGSGSDANGYEWNVWSPRVIHMSQATLALLHDKPYVECKADEHRPLTVVPADQAKTIIDHAKFLPVFWQRSAVLLARDEDGVYYYVDHLTDARGGKDYKVYVGPKGAMKEVPMTNIVSDSAGQIFATKRGELRIVVSNTDDTGDNQKVTWRKGTTRTELVRLELWPNRYLIYRELGIYGKLGIVCEDQ